ncbi:hypothetical protein BKA56DRAFT_623628 [Ilyonectria sp. MPI-CAGE-AT-0026]|nr:hypothetical protein BKA56DRAFT_623628 [Ilyonectria sp. MPI-CAGE-AT-0026]
MSRSRTYRLMKEAYVAAYIFRRPKEGLFEREHDLLRPIPGYFCIPHMARFKPMNLLTERHSRWRQDRSEKQPSPIPWCLRVRLSHGSLGLHKYVKLRRPSGAMCRAIKNMKKLRILIYISLAKACSLQHGHWIPEDGQSFRPILNELGVDGRKSKR